MFARKNNKKNTKRKNKKDNSNNKSKRPWNNVLLPYPLHKIFFPTQKPSKQETQLGSSNSQFSRKNKTGKREFFPVPAPRTENHQTPSQSSSFNKNRHQTQIWNNSPKKISFPPLGVKTRKKRHI